jgi:oligogalacturonide lyase
MTRVHTFFWMFAVTWVSGLAQRPQQPASTTTNDVPEVWVDSQTGHRVTRLTSEADSKSIYFSQNAFLPDGKQMVYLANGGLYVVTLTRTHPTRLLVPGPVSSVIVGRTTPKVYFTRKDDQGLYSVDVTTTIAQKVLDIPPNLKVMTLNADDTVFAGTVIEAGTDTSETSQAESLLGLAHLTQEQMDAHLAKAVPMGIFTLDLRSGAIRTVFRSTDWLGEVVFSPVNPALLMYCHEGSWLKVDRIWTIRTDGTHNEVVHKRTLSRETTGSAFWDADGETVWYDLQMPLGENVFLASYNVKTRQRKRYPIERDLWSVHNNASTDDSLFCGDGSDSLGPVSALDGKWLELFWAKELGDDTSDANHNLVQNERFRAHHLVDMSRHNYKVEPNARFTPDHRMVIFTSNMFGPSYVFAVDVGHPSVKKPEPQTGKVQ